MGRKRKELIIACHQDGQEKETECRRDESGGAIYILHQESGKHAERHV